MNKDLIPFLMDMARLVPGVDMGAALARGVEGKGEMSDALAFLPFLGWAKKAKGALKAGSRIKDLGEDLRGFGRFLGFGEGSEAAFVKRMASHAGTEARAAQGASKLRAAEQGWAEGLGGLRRAAPPMPLASRAAHEVGQLGVPFFQQYPTDRATDRLAEEMFRNMEKFK